MALLYLDTNIIIRYLTADNPDFSKRSYDFLQQVELGAITVTTCEAVIIETVQVLSSKTLYNLPRSTVKDHISAIVRLRGLRLTNKQVYLRALDLFASTNLDFPDALIVAHMEHRKVSTLVSFDRDFDKIPGIIRQEP